MQVVPTSSAIIGNPYERQDSIHAHHRDMCRFEFANEGFRKLCNSITDMIYRAQEALSCGLLPKAYQKTNADEDISNCTHAVIHFDSLVSKIGTFVGRKELLEQMRNNLQSGVSGDRKRIMYLLGMGGVGKTQLALEYAQQNVSSFENVFWVSMANEESASLGFRSIYQRLQASKQSKHICAKSLARMSKTNCTSVSTNPETKDDFITLMVKLWLQNPKHTNWLLILDNLDDLESWNHKEYIPGGSNGSIVVTSRRLDLEWLGSSKDTAFIKVQELQVDEALELLLSGSRMSKSNLKGGLTPCSASMLTVTFLIRV